jgi:hypothetical protein
MTTQNPITSKEAAEQIGIEPKVLRVFLRHIGYEKIEGRYQFTKAKVTALKKQYDKYAEERAHVEKVRTENNARAKDTTPKQAEAETESKAS